jgi:hypothetical protein
MNYAILRTQKLKASAAVWRSLKHAFREQPTPNADPDRAANNQHLGASSAAEAMEKVRQKLPDKRRKDAVLCIEYLITASPEAMANIDRGKYFNDALTWLKQRHGAANVVYSGLHYDETTPHMYAYVVPLDAETGRLNARKWLGGSRALSEMQTEFAQMVGASHGLERGIKGSRATHQRVQRHYGLVNRVADQTQGLGLVDKASLSLGKPTKRASEALEAAEATLAQAHAFRASQKAARQREGAISTQIVELGKRQSRIEQREAIAAQAIKREHELQHELEALRYRAAKADELAEIYRSGRDAALDELRTLRPQQGSDLTR